MEVWEQLAADLRSVIDFDRVSVAFVHPEQGTLTEGHVAGIDVPGRRQGDVRRLAGTVAEEAVTRRTSALVTGEKPSEVWLGRFPELKPSLEAGIRGVVAVPLLRGERVDAVLEFASLDPNAYSVRHLELAQRIGSRVLGAILNSRQYAELNPESTEGHRWTA